MTKHTHTKRTNGIPWDHVLLIKKKKKKLLLQQNIKICKQNIDKLGHVIPVLGVTKLTIAPTVLS